MAGADSFFEQVTGKVENAPASNEDANADVIVQGDPFAGAGDEVEKALENESDPQFDDLGQRVDSPPTKQGQEAKESDSPADSKEKDQEASESDTSTDKKGEDDKPLPFDQDPKWKAARAAEKALNDLLTKHGIEDMDELNSMLDSGIELKNIIGSQDAKSLIDKSQKWEKAEQYWAEQEALQREQEETPEETTKRLKEEKRLLQQSYEQKEAERRMIAENQRAIQNFESVVDKAVDSSELSPDEKAIARQLLGVENPIDAIDIDDQGKVKATIGQGIDNFSKFVAKIKQDAIDEYAAGKSKMTPVPRTVVPSSTPHVEKKPSNPNASVEESFDEAKNELRETLRRLASEG